MHQELDHWGANTRWLKLGQAPLSDIFQSPYLSVCQVLRVKIDFESIEEFEKILSTLGSYLLHLKPNVCLLQVSYKLSTLSTQARFLHQEFIERYTQVSSYLPLCLPPSPLGDQVTWTSPENCSQCIFLEAQRCGGLNGDESLKNPLVKQKARAGGALRSSWSIPLQKSEFNLSTPVCYWWPEPRLIPILERILTKNKCQNVWDIGGGNGFVAWWLKQRFNCIKQAFCIDPVADLYTHDNGVNYLAIDAAQALARVKQRDLIAPDLMVISWPSPGLLFAQVIECLQPKVLIRVSDSQGACGVRRGHRALVLNTNQCELYGLTEAFDEYGTEFDDLEPPPGYKLAYSDILWCYRDFQSQASKPSALFRVYEIQASGIL